MFLEKSKSAVVSLIMTMLCIFALPALVLANPNEGFAIVLRIIDGDTIDVVYHEEVERLRFYAVDAPETVHPQRKVEPFGPEASELVKKLLPVGTVVRLEFEKHKRGAFCRLQAHVWVGDTLVSAELVKRGLAKVENWKYEYKNKVLLEELQKKASDAHEGVWGLVEIPAGAEKGI